MSRWWLLFVTIMLAAGMTLPASAQMMGGAGGGMMQGGGGGMGHMMGQSGGPRHGDRMDMARPHEGPQVTMMLYHRQELGLNAEQVRKIQELRTTLAKDLERKRAETRVAEIDLNALLEQDRWDLARVETMVKQIATLRADLRLARLKTIQAARALLTPEQLEKLKQVGHRMGHAGGGPRQGMGAASPASPTHQH